MIESYPWLSILPPLIAIAIAIKYRQVYVALLIGIWSGKIILANGNFITAIPASIDECITVFQDPDMTRVIIFSAFIGALIAFTQRSGGVQGFIDSITKRKLITSRRKAQFMTVGIGAAIPIESSINVLITGTVSRPIFDNLKISREKLAYLCDSISAPICSLIPINAWGAYIAGLLAKKELIDPYKLYLMSIPLNFYAIFAILLVVFLIFTQKDYFTMKKAERRAEIEGKVLRDGAVPLISSDVISIPPKENVVPKAYHMIIPVISMIVMMIVFMILTGDGNITSGKGATSVLGAVISAISISGLLILKSRIMNFNELVQLFFKGVGGLIPIAILMMFAFAIGSICDQLQTGKYIADISSQFITPKIMPALLFIVTGIIAFSTGTSWGTWGIMFPIGIGIAQNLGISILPFIGALVSGGVFGDHCSPISDTTLVSSMASASDHIDHVNTQLPYALIAGTLSLIMFLIVGFIMY
ncbi:Na+/H+ antiporter NhaC family protein [candidate division KSB1 bacterium]